MAEEAYEASDESTSLTHTEEQNVMSGDHEVKLIAGHNKWEWTFISLMISGMLLLMFTSIVYIRKCHADAEFDLTYRNVYYLSEIAVCLLSCVVIIFSLYAMFYEHMYDARMSCSISFVTCMISFYTSSNPENCMVQTKTIISCITMFIISIATGCSQKAVLSVDWTEFRIVGSSETLTAMYKLSCEFLSLIKVDAVVQIAYVFVNAEALFNFRGKDWTFFVAINIVYAFFVWVCGKLSIVLESRWLTGGFCLVNGTYIGFVGYQVYICWMKYQQAAVPGVYIIIFIFEMLVMVIKLFSMIKIIQACKTFGNGLNSESFQNLVSRRSSLLVCPRSVLVP